MIIPVSFSTFLFSPYETEAEICCDDIKVLKQEILGEDILKERIPIVLNDVHVSL